MSDNKTEYSYYIKVKNESARKRLGFLCFLVEN